MNIRKSIMVVAAVVAIAALIVSCSVLKDISQSLNDMQRLKFRLESVDGFRLSGIALKEKTSLKSFDLTDGLKLSRSFVEKSFPAEFILNVEAKNPNDGTKGTRASTALLQALEWRLLIDDVPTVTGNIDKPVEIPATGSTTIVPLRVSIDLYKFFGDKGYESAVNLALAIGGASGSTARLKLDVKPTVKIAGVEIPYPGRITVVDKTFN